MGEPAKFPIVLNQTFIEATRDTGYRSTAAAIAELVDNSIQAGAKNVSIFIKDDVGAISIAVLDDGSGMDASTLRRALQFGGSMRFGDRSGMGRFGMGLPNASVSQARRADVYTWRAPNVCQTSHLDIDEIAIGRIDEIPSVKRSTLPSWVQEHRGFSGTLVVWSKCDRLDNRRLSTIANKLHEPLGRFFRHFIWKGVKILINGEVVPGIDPLFLHPSSELKGAKQFGDPMTFEVRVPNSTKTSIVQVRFTELPVTQWHDMPVEEKRRLRIVDGAGLSILRANREVDYGWWFFGAKRRENYDSWWRGELLFDPELDELFSITHSKQGINPTQELREILTPDLESAARQLNSRVQHAFGSVKAAPEPSKPVTLPISAARPEFKPIPLEPRRESPKKSGKPQERAYFVVVESKKGGSFFEVREADGKPCLVINSKHPFFHRIYSPLCDDSKSLMRELVEKMLLAHHDSGQNADACLMWSAKLREMLEEGK